MNRYHLETFSHTLHVKSSHSQGFDAYTRFLQSFSLHLVKFAPAFCPPCVTQIGLGHDFGRHTTGVRWRVSSIWKNSASRQLQVPLKATFPLCPGVDLRTYFNAEYSLPDLHGWAIVIWYTKQLWQTLTNFDMKRWFVGCTSHFVVFSFWPLFMGTTLL